MMTDLHRSPDECVEIGIGYDFSAPGEVSRSISLPSGGVL